VRIVRNRISGNVYKECFTGNAYRKGFRGNGLEEMVTGIEQRMLIVPDTK